MAHLLIGYGAPGASAKRFMGTGIENRESRIEISFALNRFRLIISVEQLKDEWGSERLVIESSERKRMIN